MSASFGDHWGDASETPNSCLNILSKYHFVGWSDCRGRSSLLTIKRAASVLSSGGNRDFALSWLVPGGFKTLPGCRMMQMLAVWVFFLFVCLFPQNPTQGPLNIINQMVQSGALIAVVVQFYAGVGDTFWSFKQHWLRLWTQARSVSNSLTAEEE